MTPTISATTMNDINAEISKHEETIRCLKSRRNALTLISRLPVEVLCHIFILTSRESTQSQCIQVSHVCTQWRNAALGCPALWSNLTFKSAPEWVHEMIKRSMEAPLIINANMVYGTPMMRNAVAAALKRIGRTVELTLSGPIDDMQTTFLSLHQPAPFLRVLSLTQIPVPLSTRLSIPDDLFSGYTPSLRKLTIQFCQLGWNSTLLKNLTHLVVRSPGEDGVASIDELLPVLRNMPLLEHLELYDALTLTAVNPDSDSYFRLGRIRDVVQLPRLLELRVGSGVMAVTELLLHLSIPLATKVDISVEGSAFCNHSFTPFLSALDRCVQHSTRLLRRPVDTLSVTIGSASYLRIQAWPDENHNTTPFLALELDCLGAGCFPPIKPALKKLRLRSTVELDSSLMELLRRCYNVESIALDNATADFINVLGLSSRKRNDGKSSEASGSLAFPALRTLCMRNVEFPLGVDHLREALGARVSRGMKLHTLQLEECVALYEDDVDRLVGLVEKVNWDGVEQSISEDEDTSGSDFST
ncbi:hypothetical protein BDZ89DRAFT_1058191 [Hymenopellis radicata]|nr:hypothetical protein BDZ89DRAFT_1058191 [Hymenopellis radicata]